MTSRTINTYIIREIAATTVMGICLFTVLVLISRILRLADMVLNKGVPLTDIGLLFLYTMASYLVLTIPFSFLMAILIAFGRLSADSEIVAMKASGIGLAQMLRPTLTLASGIVLITALMSNYLAPASNNAFRNKLFEIASSKASIGIQPQVFNSDFDDIVLYTAAMDDQTGILSGLFISDERLKTDPAIISAHNGQIISDTKRKTLTLHLEEGSIHRESLVDGEKAYQVIAFQTYDVNLDLGGAMTQTRQQYKKLNQLSSIELIKGRNTQDDRIHRLRYEVELLDRLILPLTPLLFALIGVPLGIQSTRSGRGGGFAIGLVIFLVYYVLYSLNKNLTLKLGITSLSMLLPPSIFLFFGGYIYTLAAQERPFTLLTRITLLFQKKSEE
ncbi:MAG: LPS export ABC transporter permease LptF [Desulfuromonadales bacterium]|nr:LPS export ABC transporter permease LptF [Desulfuromonadales bacterium]